MACEVLAFCSQAYRDGVAIQVLSEPVEYWQHPELHQISFSFWGTIPDLQSLEEIRVQVLLQKTLVQDS